MSRVVSTIVGQRGNQHPSQENISFSHLESFDKRLVDPKPDLYYGARPEQIDERVRDELGKYIVPSSDTTLPAVPNFFPEGKSIKGRTDTARRQACHDGAAGARAMHQLQNYRASTPVYDGNAYTITSTYHDYKLNMYATHPTEPKVPGGRPEYHMTLLYSISMEFSADSFRVGAEAYRNARDLAKEYRDRLIANANEVAQRRSAEPASFSTTTNRRNSLFTTAGTDSAESDTSVDELAIDHGTNSKRPRR